MCMFCISYLNQITPQKQQGSNQEMQRDLDKLVADACDPNGGEMVADACDPHEGEMVAVLSDPNEGEATIAPTKPQRRSVRKRLFGSQEPSEPILKRIKTVNGEKCPISDCKTHITHAKNLMRHLKQKHGDLQRDGTFGLVRFVCRQANCKVECLNKTNILNHQSEQHQKKAKKYERIVYEIDESTQIQLAPYFNK